MAEINNTTKAADLVKALDVEAVTNYKHDHDRLLEILGIFGVEKVAAGTALYRWKVTGELSDAEVAEGDETPLSKFIVDKDPVGEITTRPFRRLITHQAILKSGFENAVLKGDRKMLTAMRNLVVKDFFSFLAAGTLTASGTTLQATLAMADATLEDELESKDDASGALIHFVNRFDIADYLADAAVTTQTVYGMIYLKSFLGVENIFVTSKVPKGTVYVTPVENIHVYGIDFAALADGGLAYEVDASGVIGVSHQPNYARTSCEVNALLGETITAEIVNYIVKATIGGGASAASLDAEPAVPEKVDSKSTKAQLTAYAAAHGIDVSGCETNAEILAAIQAAEADPAGDGE